MDKRKKEMSQNYFHNFPQVFFTEAVKKIPAVSIWQAKFAWKTFRCNLLITG